MKLNCRLPVSALLLAIAAFPCEAQEVHKRPALPFPPRAAATEAPPAPAIRADRGKSVTENRAARNVLEGQKRALERRIHEFDLESICGMVDDSQHVERYDGTLGPTRTFVDGEQPSTAQIQWRNVSQIMTQPGDNPGNISEVRWCSGTLISSNQFLTAGHCFDTSDDPTGWITPKRKVGNNLVSLPPASLAPLMQLNFNYQVNAETGEIRAADVFPVVKLLEHRKGNLDYAILEVGKNAAGELPNVRYRVANFDASQQTLNAANLLTIIQHPHGEPKLIEAGPKDAVNGSTILYRDLDTRGGSSGSGIIDQNGRVIGVHTNGGCTAVSGTNQGVTLRAISQSSGIIH